MNKAQELVFNLGVADGYINGQLTHNYTHVYEEDGTKKSKLYRLYAKSILSEKDIWRLNQEDTSQ